MIDRSSIACVSLAVPSISGVIDHYTRGLGFEVTRELTESPRGFGLRWVELGYEGSTALELLEPTGTQSGPVDRFLERNGSGVFQVRLMVDAMRETLAELQARGVEVITGQSVPGWPEAAWVHPRYSGGVLLELIERN